MVNKNQEIGSIQDNFAWKEERAEQTGPRLVPDLEETEYTKKMKGGFSYFGLLSFLYACFYAFCMFRSPSGITYPFFVGGSLLFFGSALSKLGISLRKGSVFYMAGMMLLAVSTFCTDDGRLIWMNKAGICLLLFSLLLHQFYDTARWNLGKYLGAMLRLVFASLGELGRPFQDAGRCLKSLRGGRGEKIFFVGAGIALAAPVFAIVFLLLASADVVFRELGSRWIRSLNLENIFPVCCMVVLMFLAVYCLLSYLCKKSIPEEVPDRRKGEPILAITVTGMLTALYLVFSVIQILYLFLGKMQLPQNYTYAEYAREGFFQLLAVGILNLVMVLGALAFFRESKVLKAVLAVMSLCTFIMIASSALRMIIYIRYYYLTFLRILVLWSLAVLFLLFVGVVIGIFRDRFPLFRYSCVVVTCCYLALSFAHPDYWIARVNVDNISGPEMGSGEMEELGETFFVGNGYHDYRYLSKLSADAAPVLVPFLAEQVNAEGEIYLDGSPVSAAFGIYALDQEGTLGNPSYIDRLYQKEEKSGIRSWNVSRWMAFRTLDRCWENRDAIGMK